MIRNENKLKELLTVLSKEKMLDKIIIIGSWCQYFYEKQFDNFKPYFMTTDIDLYVPDTKRANTKGSLISSLKELNYDLYEDTLTNKSKFHSPDGFELEFLTNLKRNDISTAEIGNTKIYAETLPYVNVFNKNYIEVNYQGLKVKVASPSSYVLQKLLIISNRKEKIIKDLNSINYLLMYINESDIHQNELRKLFDSFPKKWRIKIENTINKNNIKCFIKQSE